jgi:Fe-S cluster assembly ATPase SufC
MKTWAAVEDSYVKSMKAKKKERKINVNASGNQMKRSSILQNLE